MFLAMDSQAVMAGTHDQNVEMNVQKARKLRGVNSVDLNKTALRIPVPGTSALSPRLHQAAGPVTQRRLNMVRMRSGDHASITKIQKIQKRKRPPL